MVDYAKETLDRAERERARLLSQLEVATTALQAAVDKLSAAVKEHYDRVAEIDRLRVHVKENILYYMQAIWRQEPPDQRFFRIYDLDVPDREPVDTARSRVAGDGGGGDRGRASATPARQARHAVELLPDAQVTVTTKKLVEVADLDNVLGYKGNYMIFALKENNYITLQMMQDYLEVGDELIAPRSRRARQLQRRRAAGARDVPHPERTRSSSRTIATRFKQMLIERLTSPRKRKRPRDRADRSSLYIECLVGTHPLLEDFKLIHRALDVKKVQAEVRHAELENIRLAARALEGQRRGSGHREEDRRRWCSDLGHPGRLSATAALDLQQ